MAQTTTSSQQGADLGYREEKYVIHAPQLSNAVYVKSHNLNSSDDERDWEVLEVWDIEDDTWSLAIPGAKGVGDNQHVLHSLSFSGQNGVSASFGVENAHLAPSTPGVGENSSPLVRHFPIATELLSFQGIIRVLGLVCGQFHMMN